MKISWFESQGALPALAFLGEIRVLAFGLVCELEYGISTFDSESFELELNGSAWDISGLSFVQIPSVLLEIRFRPMYTISGLPCTRTYLKSRNVAPNARKIIGDSRLRTRPSTGTALGAVSYLTSLGSH